MKFNIDPRAEVMTDQVLECRSDNHGWVRQSGYEVVDTTRRGVISTIKVERNCYRCGTVRLDTYVLPSFSLLKRHYVYPDGYTIKKDENLSKLLRQDFRAALLTKELKDLDRKIKRD